MKQAAYGLLPQFYSFKSRDEWERILYKNFVQAGQNAKEMIKNVLNKRGGIFACPLFLYNPCILHFRDKYSNLSERRRATCRCSSEIHRNRICGRTIIRFNGQISCK